MNTPSKILGLLASAGCCLLSGCAEMPDNPTVDVSPAPGTSWQVFSAQREYCKRQAEDRVHHSISRANTRGIIGGVVATALGAGIGAAAGGGGGAGIGAAAGALAGTAGGGLYSNSANGGIQSAYNIGYLQCMRASSAPPPQSYPSYQQQQYQPQQYQPQPYRPQPYRPVYQQAYHEPVNAYSAGYAPESIPNQFQ